MKKFNCDKCGNCCGPFKVKNDVEYPFFVEGSSIIQFSEPRLMLHDWEKEFFPDGTVTPGTGFLDLKNNRVILLNYTITKESCPKLENNLCSIHSDKPLACWLYPCSLRDVDDIDEIQSAFGICKAELPPEELKNALDIENSSSNEIRKKLYERYGDGFIYGLVSKMIQESYAKFIVELEKKGEIKLAKEGYPINFLNKRMANAEKIDVSELFYEYNKAHLHIMMLSNEGIRKVKNNIGIKD